MRRLVVLVSAVVIILSLNPSSNFASNYNDWGYEMNDTFHQSFQIKGISKAGGFYIERSWFRKMTCVRDIKTGRLTNVIEHEPNSTYHITPFVQGKFIMDSTYNEDMDKTITKIYDRDDLVATFHTTNNEFIVPFDDELILIEYTQEGDFLRLKRLDEGDTVWERDIPGATKIYSPHYYNESKRHIWVYDENEYVLTCVNPIDGKVLLSFYGNVYMHFSNGDSSLIVTTSETGSYIHLLNIYTASEVYSSSYDDNFPINNQFSFHNQKVILSRRKCDQLPSQKMCEMDVVIIDTMSKEVEEYAITLPNKNGTLFLRVYDINSEFVVFSNETRQGCIVKELKTDRIVYTSPDIGSVQDVELFGTSYMFVHAGLSCAGVDLENMEIHWVHKSTSMPVICEFEDLLFIRHDDKIRVYDSRFDVWEPYTYNIEKISRNAEFVPTRFGMVVLPTGGSSRDSQDLMLLLPEIDEPIYQAKVNVYEYFSDWEYTSDPEYLKLVRSSLTGRMDVTLWLHIRTGVLVYENPELSEFQ
ncbi:MAG TPA: hypothetical protein PKV16_05280 [Caldisericia bacterium]|nr:hypothetical protein [Caldisericia bacterium]HPF48726.1 hypothetical protein [Caldisericia bacterium]HPI83614.1 hypothetical protein [Caldisericia bacterium]HPQ93181.1 hypothetical protein [Caldisericia bacterium]HRV74986.1 hypothetical protein [Caldisericia bacterium]